MQAVSAVQPPPPHTPPHTRALTAPAPPSTLCSMLQEGINGLHLYTLNMEECVYTLLERLDLKKPVPVIEAAAQ